MSNNAIQTISFFTTNECNLACSYCYEKNKNNQNADFVIAKEIIDNSFIKYSNKKVVFDFFGGEPFLNFIFIKKVVDYIEKKYIDKQFAFSVSTNGTILTEKVKKFLIAHRRKIEVGLSLDGCIKYHNDSRCNSFKDIDLSWWIDNGIVHSTKMTISLLSIDNFYNNLMFCESLGLKVNCNLAFGQEWTKKELLIFKEELKKIITYYLSKKRFLSLLPFCNLLDINWLSNIVLPTEKRKRFCGAGCNMLAYDTNGNEYPCQMFAPVSAGQKALIVKNIKIYDDCIPESETLPECNACIYKNICRTCIGSNWLNSGYLYKNDMKLCEFEKARFDAMAYFALKIYELNKLQNYPNATAILRGLKIIFESNKNKYQ